MEGVTFGLIVVIGLAVTFDYINGFHDTANSIATSVATRALRPSHAILMAAAFNFIGAFAGTAVAKTIGAGLVDEETTTQAVVGAALSLGERFSLSHWDSMVLGACRTAGATRLYTEDLGAPRIIDGIELINPFA
jgi:PiT family inorganic phosphate transporter